MSYASHVESTTRDSTTREHLDRVIDAGQRMISARFDLLSLELKETVSGALKTGFFTIAGGVLLVLGHIAGMVATALGLSLLMPAWAAVLIVAGIHFVLGGVAVVVGLTMPHKPKLSIAPDEAHEAQRRLPSPATGRPVPRHLDRPLVYRPQGT